MWVQSIFDTYSSDGLKFFNKDKNQFSNPVGYTISGELVKLVDEIRQGFDADKIRSLLEYFIKIRAVQDFTPSKAVAFILQLKLAVRANLKEEIRDGAICEELLQFESRLDEVELVAFEIYSECRNKISELRTKQAGNGLFERHDRSGPPDGKGKHV